MAEKETDVLVKGSESVVVAFKVIRRGRWLRIKTFAKSTMQLADDDYSDGDNSNSQRRQGN